MVGKKQTDKISRSRCYLKLTYKTGIQKRLNSYRSIQKKRVITKQLTSACDARKSHILPLPS